MKKSMVCLLALAAAARADITNQSVTLKVNNALNMDNGTTGLYGGDILLTGTSITLQGNATAHFLGASSAGPSEYTSLTQAYLSGANFYNQTPLTQTELVVNSVFAVHTNGGNYAKALITAVNGSATSLSPPSSFTSLTITFTTYGGVAASASAPTITDIVNNSSLIPVGLPNYGVAPSTLFVIHGTGMASATSVSQLQDSTNGLPTTLNGATVTISANGQTYTPGLYYAEATQIAGVLPAAVPPGTATVSVSYNNNGSVGTSAAYSFLVVPAAYGIDTYDGNLAVAQDALTYGLVSYANSARPGQIVILWGSGLGADSADSDTTYTSSPHSINTPIQVYVGGVQVSSVAYAGASVYPGVHIIQMTLPSGVPNGCFVPIAVVANGNIISNVPIIPFMDNGGACSDSLTGITGSQISAFMQQSAVSIGALLVSQTISPGANGEPGTTNNAIADFTESTNFPSSLAGTAGLTANVIVAPGTCSLNDNSVTQGQSYAPPDPGTVTVTPPNAAAVALEGNGSGFYDSQLPAGDVPTSGGTFSFAGSGGSGTNAVGPFSATVEFPSPALMWANQSVAATITRSAGLTYTWSGGAPGSWVIVSGLSSSGSATASYACLFPQAALQGVVPGYILSGLPAGTGSTSIESFTPFTTFTASGIDYGFAFSSVSISVNNVYK